MVKILLYFDYKAYSVSYFFDFLLFKYDILTT